MLDARDDRRIHDFLCDLMICLSPIVYLWLMLDKPAPLGKHSTRILMSGLCLKANLAWFLFEFPNLLWSMFYILKHQESINDVLDNFRNQVLLAAFVLHYTNRSILYPLQISNSSTPVPIEMVLCAFAYTFWNG